MRIAVILSFLAALLLGGVAVAQDVEVRLVLTGAVHRPELPPDPQGPSLVMDLAKRDGVWDRVWGFALTFNRGTHQGLVLADTITEDAIRLELLMDIGGDPYVKGGRGRYVVEMRKAVDGGYAGTLTGTFRGVAISGSARATRLPARAHMTPGRAAVAPGEHPRLLFRKTDLPALRAKAETPFGRAALAKMDGVVGKAMQYQLTGDRQHAEAIIPAVEAMLVDNSAGDLLVRGRNISWRLEQMALAYDLCYDVWPGDLKQRVRDHCVGSGGWRGLSRGWSISSEIDWWPSTMWWGSIKAGSGVAALALWGEKGSEPQKPSGRLFLYDDPAPRIAPRQGFAAGEGVVPRPLVPGQSYNQWLCAGGFPAGPGRGQFEGMEAAATLTPGVGTPFTRGERTEAFRLVTKYHREALPITDLARRESNVAMLFYQVLENDTPRYVRLETAVNARTWVNGTELRHGDCARLERGTYTVMIAAWAGHQSTPWGNDLMTPRFQELTREHVDAWVADLEADRAVRLRLWEADYAQWVRTGGADIEVLKLHEYARASLLANIRESVGHGGYMANHLMGLEGTNRYATAYRNVFGADLSPYPDITHFLARGVFTLTYGATGPGRGSMLDGTHPFISGQIFTEKPYDLSGPYFTALYPLTPEPLRPSVLWAWRRQMGIGDEADAARALSEPARPYPGFPKDLHAVWTFVTYPLGGQDAHPSTGMPHTWRADTYGWYAFRNAWRDNSDVLFQVGLRPASSSYRDAGTFRLTGLGQEWVHGRNAWRQMEPVVQLPDDTINEEGRGRLLHYEAKADGSGAVTFDLNEVYCAPSRGLYEVLDVHRPERTRPSGITGLRAIGVDYSGKAGVPALIVLVDRVEGAKSTRWWWPVDMQVEARPSRTKDPQKAEAIKEFWPDTGGLKEYYRLFTHHHMSNIWRVLYGTEVFTPGPDVALDGNAFTITRGGASLRGQLVTPAAARLSTQGLSTYRITGRNYDIERRVGIGVAAEGQGEYLAVITLGTGAPPAIAVEGEGLNAKITVGGQTARFDGKKVVFGE